MKEKKDVLFFCQFFYPEYVSSATLPFDTAAKLVNAGYRVGVLCGYPKEYSTETQVLLEEDVNGIHIKRMKYVQMKRSNVIGRLMNYLSLTVAAAFHLPYMKNYKVVIVYSNPPLFPIIAFWAKKLYGIKLMFVAYDLYPEIAVKTYITEKNSVITKVMNAINKSVYKNASCVIALSKKMKDFMIKNRPVIEKKVVVIPNWYEDLSDKYAKIRKENKFAEKYKSKFVISYLGNMGTCQDMETIIECIRSLKEYKDIQFLFAGHGNKVQYLREVIRKENLLCADVYDFLQGDDYHDALAVSDCSIVSLVEGISGLCSPSKTYGYMMAGNVILAIMDDSDIVHDIHKYEIGVAVKNGEGKKMAEQIVILKNNPQKLARMKENSVKTFKAKYTKDRCTEKYVKVIDKLIRNKG